MTDDLKAGFYDIKFNFLVSKFSAIEGRGWDTQPDFNGTMKNFLYIGLIDRATDFDESRKLSRRIFNRLIADGKVLGKISPDYNVTHDDLLEHQLN